MALLVENKYFKIRYSFNNLNCTDTYKGIVVGVYNNPQQRAQEKIHEQNSKLFLKTYKNINDLNIANYIKEVDALQHSGKYSCPEELQSDKPELIANFLKEQDERDDLWLFERDLLKQKIDSSKLKALSKWKKLGFNDDWLNKWNQDLDLYYMVETDSNDLENLYIKLKELLKTKYDKVEDC